MQKQYHILNGDSLKEQFPEDIRGKIIVARECLVDGNVNGTDLAELFQTRAQFISTHYKGHSEQDYYEKAASEFQKMQKIPYDAEVNLWFEDDLFCQVNFWFTVYLLYTSEKNNALYLIRPPSHNQYGFGGLSRSELISAYNNRTSLIEVDKLANLWRYYQNDAIDSLFETAKALEDTYPFILPAVKAHMERIPTEGDPGRPVRSLIQIMNELETKEFGPIFKEFCRRESIYGFGDSQVERLLNTIENNL